mmetsp:Transcript_5815/g.14130  ORF Transcript_5815/g.14130 Transcript_5815/m.14130 type:complete len:283 (-) Transcript_5815:195-1043(-)
MPITPAKRRPRHRGDTGVLQPEGVGAVVQGLRAETDFSGLSIRSSHGFAKSRAPVLPASQPDPFAPSACAQDARVTVGPVEFANFFIFGAGDANYFSLFSEAAAIPALHNTTTERVCVDAPLYTKSFMPQGPDMLILASNFWDVARWWEQGYALSPEENLREQIVDRYLSDVERLMDNAKKCFPGASVYCWRTHPNLATDNRNKHYASKRPHVVAALNQAGREAASRKGWCLLDFDQMVEGHANERLWVPDGLHPGGFVMMQYANVVLNTLYQAKQWEVPRD